MQNNNNELVFGLVAPLGVDLFDATEAIERVLAACGYESARVSLSQFLHEDTIVFEGALPTGLDDHIDQHQGAGNNLRMKMGRNDAVALGALLRINIARKEKDAKKLAFIVRQLKTPDEVKLLRKVYRERFVLIGIYAEKDKRKEWLSRQIAKSKDEGANWTKFEDSAKRLIDRDEAEATAFGQQARETYAFADLFATWAGSQEEIRLPKERKFETQVERFVHGLLGDPLCVPTTEEFLMFQARAVALRSADLARQVGAIIATTDGSVIAVGRNDDPRVGGGVVSRREKEDPAQDLKRQTIKEVLDCIADWIKPEYLEKGTKRLAEDAAMTNLRSSRLMGLGEFGRMVHAEMAAIADAASRGVPVKDQIIFCTTFPCQNCAKHLMAAGIRALVHIEPYPKSLVLDMYPKETAELPMEPLASDDFAKQMKNHKDKFLLLNFMGVAPRRYAQMFEMPRRKDDSGNPLKWKSQTAEPKLLSSVGPVEHSTWELQEAIALNPFLKKSIA